MIRVERYTIPGVSSGVMIADWGNRVAFASPRDGKICIYDIGTNSLVKCADIPKPSNWNAPVVGLPIWNRVIGSTITGVYVYGFGGKVGAVEFTVSPDNVSAGQPVEVSVNACACSVLDATFTYPRVWIRTASSENNCVYLVDFETKTAKQLGCYGPGGYAIWPMVVYNGTTDLGDGKWLLSSHHYWIVGSFAYLHIIDRYNGSPSRSYTSYDSCSGSFSAHDKIVGGIWHKRVVIWGRSGGIGSNSCIYVFEKPFSNPLKFFHPVPDNPKAIVPLYALSDGYIVLEIHEHYAEQRSSVRIMKWTTGGISVLEESSENIPWNDHETGVVYYDERRGVMAYTFIGGGNQLIRIFVSGYTGDIGTTMSRMLPKYILKRDSTIQLVAAGRLLGYEPESQAEVVFISGTPPSIQWTKWLWLILLILAIVAISLFVYSRRRKE